MLVFPNPLRGLQRRKGPEGGSQGSAQLQSTSFFFPLPDSQICTLPHSVCSAPFHLQPQMLLYLTSLPKSIFFILYSLFSHSLFMSLLLLVNADDNDFPTAELQFSQDHRLQGERERERERERQRERERGFTFPEKPNLSNLQCCCAWQPNRVAFFFLTQRQSTASAAHTHAAPNQRRRIFLIFFVVVEFCSELAAMWPLPQMLRRSKPARINISSLSLSQLLHDLMPADQWRIYNVKLLNLSPDSYEHGWWQRPEHEQWRQNAHTHKHTHIHTHLRSTCLFTDGWLNVQHKA